jgi:hypothetical protein
MEQWEKELSEFKKNGFKSTKGPQPQPPKEADTKKEKEESD